MGTQLMAHQEKRTKQEELTRILASAFLLAVHLAYPRHNVEIMARGILIDELNKCDFGTIDSPGVLE